MEECHADGQLETSRAGASGVDVEDAILEGDGRSMRVPIDDGTSTLRKILALEMLQLVDDMNPRTAHPWVSEINPMQ
jgi:hypothetical protein